MQYLDLFIYNLPDLWLQAQGKKTKTNQTKNKPCMECYILIKWILEFICQFIVSPDKKKDINYSVSNNVLVSHS